MGSMEEILERVQFKFASIIGELCGEPLVLSQFAIWVDMRLAEYKLKGSISLDCSGKKIEPEWLKSLKDLHPQSAESAVNLSEDQCAQTPDRHHVQAQRKTVLPPGPSAAASVSIIKGEPLGEYSSLQSDIYPVGIHDNAGLRTTDTLDSNHGNSIRTVRPQLSNDHFLHEGQSGAKVRRLEASSASYLSPSSTLESQPSQSLASIIGPGLHDISEDIDPSDKDIEILTLPANISNIFDRGDNSSTPTAVHGGRLRSDEGEATDISSDNMEVESELHEEEECPDSPLDMLDDTGETPADNSSSLVGRDVTLHESDSIMPDPILNNTPDGRYLCEECGTTFTTKSSLQRHCRRHTGDLFKCTICSKAFTEKVRLEDHVTMKHEGGSFLCKECGKTFKSAAGVKAHEKYFHEKASRYKCAICSAQFWHLSHYSGHLNRHRDAKPNVCLHCGKSFTYRQNYLRHMRKCKKQRESVSK